MATKKPSTKRPSRSKEELQKDFDEVASASRNKEASSSRQSNLKAARTLEVKAAVENLSPEAALQQFTTLGLNLTDTLSNMQGSMLKALNELDTVREAVSVYSNELRELHGIDVVATSIDDLVTQYDVKKTEFETQDAERKLQWQQEDEERNVLRMREEEAYNFDLSKNRKLDQEKYEEEKRKRERNDTFARQDQERNWNAREEALRAAEAELVDLRKQVEELPKALAAAEGKGRGMAEVSLTKEHNHALALLQKDIAAEKAQSSSTIMSLKQQLDSAHAENESLRKQMEGLQSQIVQLTSKAFDTAQERTAFANAQSFMLTQGASTQKNAGGKA